MRILLRALVWLGVFVVTFELGFEGVLRLIAAGYLRVPDDSLFRAFHMNAERQVLSYMPECVHYDPALTYLMKPGQCRFANREYDTTLDINSAGLRDDEASLDQPEIIVLGDSHAMGWGVPTDQTFPWLLEQATGLRVLNAGVPSYGTAREVTLLKRLDTRRLKVLVIQYCNNDDWENGKFVYLRGKQVAMSQAEYEAEAAGYRRSIRYWPGKYADFAWDEAKNLLGASLFSQDEDLSPLIYQPGEGEAEATRFLQVLALSGLRLQGIRIVVININGVERRDWPFTPALRKVLQAGQVPLPATVEVVDMPDLANPDFYFRLDDHLNAEGHHWVAGQVLARLQETTPHATQ